MAIKHFWKSQCFQDSDIIWIYIYTHTHKINKQLKIFLGLGPLLMLEKQTNKHEKWTPASVSIWKYHDIIYGDILIHTQCSENLLRLNKNAFYTWGSEAKRQEGRKRSEMEERRRKRQRKKMRSERDSK